MALVTITGNAWDHNEQPVDSMLRPDLWFQPKKANTVNGLMTRREVKASLNLSTGTFSVRLERDVKYVPIMRWMVDPTQLDETVPNRAFAYCEWPPFTPVASGSIDDQPSDGPQWDRWWVSLSAPPAGFRGYWLVSDPSVSPDDTSAVIGEVRRVY